MILESPPKSGGLFLLHYFKQNEVLMIEAEKSYRRVMMKIGIAMIVFLIVFFALSLLWSFFYLYIRTTKPPREAYIISQLVYAAVYAISFAVPAGILYLTTRNEKKERLSRFSFPLIAPCYIMTAIVAGLSFSYLNQAIVGFFDFGSLPNITYPSLHSEYEIWIELLVTALMPGIFEELLFRGAILSNLLPYGKAPAILISSVLFGLMHQNPAQFLYTTMAGIILAWIAVETRSLLCSMVAHFANNAYSVFQMSAAANLDKNYANMLFFWIELAVFALGIAGALLLIFSYYKKKKRVDFSGGMFEKELAFEEKYLMPIEASRMFKISFPATVIIFVVLAGASSMIIPLISI